MAIQRLSSKLVKHGQTILATFLDSLKGSVDALEVRADATDTKIDDMKNMAVRQVGDQWLHDYRPVMPPNSAPLDGQQVPTTGIYAALHAELLAGKRPTCTEAEWQADATKRGCYVINSATGMMRLPDKNGVQPGSIKGTVGKGDSGTITAGTIQKGGVPNIKFTLEPRSNSTQNTPSSILQTDDVVAKLQVRGGSTTAATMAISGAGATTDIITVDLSRGSDAYQDGLTEVRANSSVMCWVVCLASISDDPTHIDVADVVSQVAAVGARVSTIEGRKDYARIDIAGGVARGTRTVYTNPFGINTPVSCVAEILHPTLGWITTPWLYGSASSRHGSLASYKEGEGIILRVGQESYVAFDSGTNGALSANYSTQSDMRIHVWRGFGQ